MDGINIWADTVAEYEINDLEDVDIYLQLLRNADGVKDSESADSATAESGVAISAMNPKTGDYEPIFTDSDTLSSEELSRYIRDDKLTLKYSTSSSNVVPNIIVRGK